MMRRRCSIIVLGLLGTLPCSAQAAERREAAPADQAMHWAFQPVRRPELPAVRDAAWVQNPIDAFVLAGLEARGLHPNPPATKEQLIRRVFYDLTGLPPAPEEVASFLADPSPMAYEALVDRLLASPGYGEKWARHWLDLVRFAETNSYERDGVKPNAWRYRDYVIRSLNSDKPYDQFVTEQFAGDEIRDGGSEAIIATGYYRLGIWDDEPSDPEQARYDGLDDILATTGQVFLGLTLDCARCHNHKFDPIPQQDYYRLLAFFQNINPYRNGGATDEALLFRDPTAKRVYEERLRALEQKRSETQVEIRAIEDEFRALYGAHAAEAAQPEKRARELARLLNETGASVLGSERFERYRALVRTLGELTKERPPAEAALCVTEAGPRAPESFVLARGNAHAPAEKVEPGFPAVFHAPPPALATPAPDAMTSGRRTVLARWIASRDNPMTARVMVNRLWQHHFGRGIVRSPNNFGTGGDKPTHPELLDWLASEFLANGWRLKPMHRMVLLSQAYRMSSRSDAAAVAADPSNDLFWRFDMRRLTAEEIRDSILSLTGTLNPRMYGPGVYVEIPAQVMQGQSQPGKGWGRSPPDEQARRSIYIHVKRSLLTPILQSFDLAETDRSTPTRFVSTQPTQALGMLNGDFLNQQAAALAARLTQEAPGDTTAQARRALALATGRRPADAAVRHAVELIDSLQRREGATPELALECFCLMVLNLNEFLYLD